jgi:hypothetical protein
LAAPAGAKSFIQYLQRIKKSRERLKAAPGHEDDSRPSPCVLQRESEAHTGGEALFKPQMDIRMPEQAKETCLHGHFPDILPDGGILHGFPAGHAPHLLVQTLPMDTISSHQIPVKQGLSRKL